MRFCGQTEAEASESTSHPEMAAWGAGVLPPPQSPVKGADWAESSHQRAIVNRTEGLCAHLTLPSLRGCSQLRPGFWRTARLGRGPWGPRLRGGGLVVGAVGRAEAAWIAVRRLEGQGAEVGAPLQCQEEAPVQAGNPETASETHQTPARARGQLSPWGGHA